MLYFIADLHFNHANIIRHCNRPFDSVQEMNQTLIKNWNNVVTDKDEVIILGDLYFKDSNGVLDILKGLKGRKNLILGNHDRIHGDMVKQFGWIKIYHEMYYDWQGESIPLILFHYPIEAWNKSFHGSVHIYGHVHNSEILKEMPNRFNVGAELINYTPVSVETLLKQRRFVKKDRR